MVDAKAQKKREVKAAAMLEQAVGTWIRRVNENSYLVKSQNEDHWYFVKRTKAGEADCPCMDFEIRKPARCKHISLVDKALELKLSIPKVDSSIKNIIR